MSLSLKDAKELINNGFKRQKFEDNVYPFDIFEYCGETWVIGGRLLPEGNFLCNENIYLEGQWIPSLTDLIEWLENNNCKFTFSSNKFGYKAEVLDNSENVYKAKGGTLEYTLFKVIIEILKIHGGNIVNKNIETIEAKYLGRQVPNSKILSDD